MSSVSELRKQKAEIEAKLARMELPAASALKSGDRFLNSEGQERIVTVDNNRGRYRLMGAKKFQLLRQIFSSPEAVIEHMRSNGYSRKV